MKIIYPIKKTSLAVIAFLFIIFTVSAQNTSSTNQNTLSTSERESLIEQVQNSNLDSWSSLKNKSDISDELLLEFQKSNLPNTGPQNLFTSLVPCPNSLTTTFADDNFYNGNFFDVTATNAIIINDMLINLDVSGGVGGMETVQVWYRPGSFVGFQGSTTGWTKVKETTFNASGAGLSMGGLSVVIGAGQTMGFAVVTVDNTFPGQRILYTNGTAVGNVASTNADLTIYEGLGTQGFGLEMFNARIWNGTICYDLASSCATTNTFAPMMTSGLYAGAGASDPETYYWGLSSGFIKANPTGGVGPYTYSWSNSAGYAMTGTSNMKARLFYPTGPTWVKVAITDAGAGCTIEDSVYIDWVDYTCNQPDIWFYEMCNINTNTSVCIAGTRNMRDSVKTGNYVFGPCAIATKAGTLAQSELGVNVFPNPSNGNFTYIVMGDADATFNTQVMDINGRVLFTESFTSSSTISSRQISLQGFAAGVYVIKVSSNDASTVERIIIQ